ncbi:hypothetical protein LSH36_222g00014 [Paralvinella palmiformis]|uniref:Uracil-DNA glycosylase n=1 Tax=Paralvinella palmiformis TaxID=53620 RepID=A0AAD9N463_9ANNE|nr:hypothetical protein LSH36_222g00014 [Paralvinella palmiformis]
MERASRPLKHWSTNKRKKSVESDNVEWKRILAPCFSTPNFKKMEIWLQKEYEENDVLPPTSLIFNVFNLTRYNEVKVVIIGQDPYHDHNQVS